MAGAGALKTDGREKGVPNKITADVRAMILAALDRVGGEITSCSRRQSHPDNSDRQYFTELARMRPLRARARGLSDAQA